MTLTNTEQVNATADPAFAEVAVLPKDEGDQLQANLPHLIWLDHPRGSVCKPSSSALKGSQADKTTL